MIDGVPRHPWSPKPFLAHLNQRHPDTILFLARTVAGQPDAASAQIATVEGNQIVFDVRTADRHLTVGVRTPSSVTSRQDLVTQIARLLRQGRSTSPEDALTSLESHPRVRHRPEA